MDSRRGFLKLAGLTAGAAFLSSFPRAARAAGTAAGGAIGSTSVGAVANPHFFVMITMDTGMDCTLGLNPLLRKSGIDDKDVFLEYKDEELVKSKSLLLGPSAMSLSKHAADIAIINGVVMRRDAGHASLLQYITSGVGSGKAAQLPVELFATTHSHGPLSVVSNTSVLTTGRQVNVNKFYGNLGGSDGGLELDAVLEAFENDTGNFNQDINNYRVSLSKIKMAKEQFSALNVPDGNTSLSAAGVIASLFSVEASYQGFIETRYSNDTHSNHVGTHLRVQAEAWSEISAIFDIFKKIPFEGATLFDSTTFMVVTEFSRTPFLNAAKGKDHNPYTNSVLLAGKGINGGKTYGESHVISRTKTSDGMALHMGLPIDYKTGKVISQRTTNNDVGLIFPENIAKSIGKLFGTSSDFLVEAKNYRVIPGLLK